MKSYIIILFALSGSNFCFGQSKTETINWIISKFNKWKVTDSRIGYSDNGTILGGNTEEPLSLSIINCNMVFKTNYSNIMSSGSYDKITYTLNVGDINKVEWVKAYNNDLLVISTKKSLVKESTVEKKTPWESSTYKNPSIKYIDRIIISFNTYGEDDFKNRILKAYNHLRTFCKPTKQEAEAF